jgi:hypothetical protein
MNELEQLAEALHQANYASAWDSAPATRKAGFMVMAAVAIEKLDALRKPPEPSAEEDQQQILDEAASVLPKFDDWQVRSGLR